MTATTTACLALWLTTFVNGPIHTQYYPAYAEARSSGKMLLIDFGTNFDFSTIDQKKLEGYVLCRVPIEYTIPIDGKKERLIDAPAFDCLQKQAGIAVVDLRDKSHLSRNRQRSAATLGRRRLRRCTARSARRIADPADADLGLPRASGTARLHLWDRRSDFDGSCRPPVDGPGAIELHVSLELVPRQFRDRGPVLAQQRERRRRGGRPRQPVA